MNRTDKDDYFQGLGYSFTSTDQVRNAPQSHFCKFQQHFKQPQLKDNHISCLEREDSVKNEWKEMKAHTDKVEKSSAIDMKNAIQTAQAIAMKFHNQRQSVHKSDTTTRNCFDLLSFSRCREKYQCRLQKALLKNMEYVARKDDEELQRQLQEIKRVKSVETQLQNNLINSVQERKKFIHNGPHKNNFFGVGTNCRRKQQKIERDQILGHVEEKRKKNSIYVMGIKVNGKIKEDVESEINQLFQIYGKIHRIKVYKDMKTGKLKGDALVVYDVEVDLNMVCCQLNGAELPCSSVLTVQPANYNLKDTKSKHQETNKKILISATNDEDTASSIKAETGIEDLESFFDSLN